MTKQELRKIIKEKQQALTEEYVADASEKIADHVLESDVYRNAETVFLYASMRGEPDTAAIIDRALADGKTVCLPKCTSKTEMVAIRINSRDELMPGYYGIPEPVYDESSVVISPSAIDLAVIPCISAGKGGKRLGHGAGFYDRFLAECSAVKLCISFGELASDDIPMDQYDVPMDLVITEEGIML